MAATDAQADAIARKFIAAVHVSQGQTAKVDHVELKAAAEAAYNWVESAQVSYNTALVEPFKGVASTRQKAELLVYAIAELVKVS